MVEPANQLAEQPQRSDGGHAEPSRRQQQQICSSAAARMHASIIISVGIGHGQHKKQHNSLATEQHRQNE